MFPLCICERVLRNSPERFVVEEPSFHQEEHKDLPNAATQSQHPQEYLELVSHTHIMKVARDRIKNRIYARHAQSEMVNLGKAPITVGMLVFIFVVSPHEVKTN